RSFVGLENHKSSGWLPPLSLLSVVFLCQNIFDIFAMSEKSLKISLRVLTAFALMALKVNGQDVRMDEVLGSVSVDSSVCSQLKNISVRSVIECALECRGADCVAVAWFNAESPPRCQLLTVSSDGGSGDCMTPRLLQASPPGVQ
uniref:Apple domain-containing protein n=1 Tax=Macrostomum lignano TaxID=282301 RepID=A0A1I8GQS4_9PLAT